MQEKTAGPRQHERLAICRSASAERNRRSGARLPCRSVEENYDTNGVRSARFTNELESYKVAK
jgi:hypothetical protein